MYVQLKKRQRWSTRSGPKLSTLFVHKEKRTKWAFNILLWFINPLGRAVKKNERINE